MLRKVYLCAVAATVAMVAAVAGPADAQDKRVRVQMQSNFASSLAILGPQAQRTAENMKKVSGGSIDIRFFEPGALVPAGQSFDAVGSGSLDSAWATPGFWTGKEIAFALYASVPFGPDIGEYLAWMKVGGGEKMMQELYGKFGIHSLLCNIISPEASGWFRKEIKSLDDLKGLKMRFFGLGAIVMQKFGVATQLRQAGEIFQALQLGTIDATEFSMPAMDLSLGFHQVAKHYYFPGWHQQATLGDMMWNKAKWNTLSDTQKAQAEITCEANITYAIALSESLQPKAMREIQSKGVTIHRWSPEILKAFEKGWEEVAVEQSAKSPEFKKGWDSLKAFRAEYAIWKDHGYLR